MTDDRLSGLVSEAKRALRNSPVYSMRHLDIETDGDSIVLTGRVPNFYQKQMAQEIVRHVISECHVVNSIDVD